MNSFGRLFRISIFGESHGESVGVIIDGCPPGIRLKVEDFTVDLGRRKPGIQGTTGRLESDIPLVKSGIYNGFTTGTPIIIEFKNENKNSADYEQFRSVPRPGHVDFIAEKKFNGFNDPRGSGHFSARLTVGLAAAGVIAKKILKEVSINARLIEAGGSSDIAGKVAEAKAENDSIGGIIECKIDGFPAGPGEPFFDSVESVLSHMIFSIPSVKGIEFGKGFESASMKGSAYNDRIVNDSGETDTNNCGGITGGLANGNQIVLKIAMRPPSSILKTQKAFNIITGSEEEISVKGRHDICPVLRSSVIVEAAVATALCDLYLLNRLQEQNKN